ncbi:hypothetical protein [Paludibacterium sp. B53371]|uniref:hypothetical protein n=1 Tax=Paludibacterium sp. B53371 TaxID=2806263 RepID=UPI001C04D4BC|nr:hypothetical protein [Paludibacterium sp. B53371]
MHTLHVNDLLKVTGGCHAGCYPATSTPSHTHGGGGARLGAVVDAALQGAIYGTSSRSWQGVAVGAAAGAAIAAVKSGPKQA